MLHSVYIDLNIDLARTVHVVCVCVCVCVLVLV